MRKSNDIERKAWGMSELASANGVSLGLLRMEAKRGALRVRRIGRRVVVLQEDWLRYLAQKQE